MKRKLITSIMSIMLLLAGLTGITYAVWDSLTTSLTNTVNIGKGTTIIVDVDASNALQDGNTLVPESAVLGSTDVNQIILKYDVHLDKLLQSALALTVTPSDLLIQTADTADVDTDYAQFVSITISPLTTVNNDIVEVIVTVKLLEPKVDTGNPEADLAASIAIYNKIINSPIKFKLTFKAGA